MPLPREPSAENTLSGTPGLDVDTGLRDDIRHPSFLSLLNDVTDDTVKL